MTKNPIVNALSASAYIILVVSVMNVLSQNLRNKPDTFGAPIVMLSLLTLSVTVMAFIFFYQPIQLILQGKKKEGVRLFIHTISVFGAVTAVALALLFSGVI